MTEAQKNTAIIVDDESMVAELFEMECSRLGYETITCENGQAGYDAFCANKEHTHLILSDVRMPVRDGIWLLQQVRKHQKTNVPFIFMSGYADIGLWTAFDLGADAFIGKPFRLETLTETINHLNTPLNERWKTRTIAVDNAIEISFPDRETASGQEGFRVGRGGFYIGTFDESLRRGQFVTFKIGIKDAEASLVGSGVVRWVRYGHGANEMRSAGIEFLYLEDSSRRAVINHITKANPVAYIPAQPANV